MITKQTLKEIGLLIGFIAAIWSTFYTIQFASECHAVSGAVVKGIILWECIK